PGERSRAQRGNVRAAEAIRKTEVVPDEGPDVGEQVVTQRHRLRPLKMRVAGHGDLGVGFGEVEEGELESQERLSHGDDRVSQKQAFVERDLIIPTPGRVELRTERTETFRERYLNVRVDVFQLLPPNEATGGDLLVDAAQAFPDEFRLLLREDADRGEHVHVGEAPCDVVPRRGSASRPLRLDRGRHSYFALFAAFTSFVEAGAFAPAAAQVRAGSPQT